MANWLIWIFICQCIVIFLEIIFFCTTDCVIIGSLSNVLMVHCLCKLIFLKVLKCFDSSFCLWHIDYCYSWQLEMCGRTACALEPSKIRSLCRYVPYLLQSYIMLLSSTTVKIYKFRSDWNWKYMPDFLPGGVVRKSMTTKPKRNNL